MEILATRGISIFLCSLLALFAVLAPAQNSHPDSSEAKPPVYEPGKDGVTTPKRVYSVDPEYTDEGKKLRLQGVVALSLVVNAQGKPEEVKVTRSLAETAEPKDRTAAKGMDDKAVEAVSQYRFQPATLKGEPVAAAIHVEVNCQLF